MSSSWEFRVSPDPAPFAASLCLRAGFIGASLAAAGLLDWMDAKPSSLIALALVLFGTVLAAFAWRHGRSALEPAERVNALHSTADIVVSPGMIERRGQS